jgi:hypothetical protein
VIRQKIIFFVISEKRQKESTFPVAEEVDVDRYE